MNRKEKRQAFYGGIENFWADLYGMEYSLYDILPIEKEEADKIQVASQRAGQIFFKMAKLLRQLDDETVLELGFPKEAVGFLRLNPITPETVISRLDLVNVEDTYKVLEINSDTPTFIKELFLINGLVCNEFGYENPNKEEEENLAAAVRSAIFQSYQSLGLQGKPNIVFTAHDDNVEDKNTLLYLREIAGVPSKFVPLHELKIIEGEGLYDSDDERIDILYRQTFPIEMLLLDRDPDSEANIGSMLLQLVELGKLAVINPPSAFLLQSKAVQAVIWGLHEEKSPFFAEEEHGWIQEHFLPTYLEADSFLEKGEKYVKKPVFGREGDTVEVYEGSDKVMEDNNKSYAEYLPVYQQYVDLPKTKIQTENGEKEAHVMVGSFLLNGHPSAFGFRVGGQITDNLSYFLPVGISKMNPNNK